MGDKSLKILQTALLGASLLIAVASTASAADINKGGSLKDTPVAYMPAITWTGFYFGANLGVAFADNDASIEYGDSEGPIETINFEGDDNTWLAGLHVGYNWQKPGGWVFGIEGDVSFADDIDYLATIRGRLGYAMDSTLFYVTGGGAFIGFDDGFGDSQSETGWVVGLGLEHKLRPNVSIGLESLYYNFGDGEDFTIEDGEGEYARFRSDDADFWTIRARLTYHFGDRHEEPLK